jgi:hypothetical protein
VTRYILWGIVCGLVIGGSGWLSAQADAATIQNPSICVAFDKAPTFASVNQVMQSMLDNGHDVKQASELVVKTVESRCPQHLSLLRAYVDAGVFLYPELSR